MKKRYPTSIRLSDETKRLLARVAETMELSHADVIAMAIRLMAIQQGVISPD
jgi:predicted transcriptional regulator